MSGPSGSGRSPADYAFEDWLDQLDPRKVQKERHTVLQRNGSPDEIRLYRSALRRIDRIKAQRLYRIRSTTETGGPT